VTRPLVVMLGGAVFAVVLGVAVMVYLPRWFAPETTEVPREVATDAPDAGRRIRATLFFVAEDGLTLIAVDAEVPFAASTADQARRLLEAQLGEAPEPYAQPIAEGTTVRQIFLSDAGDAFVDLSREAITNHHGGSLDELFAVYAIVNTLTVNLPAVRQVQILVDGQEVDTLAGHIDLRHPLTRNLTWVRTPEQDGGRPEELTGEELETSEELAEAPPGSAAASP
jgi:hypothetical protein